MMGGAAVIGILLLMAGVMRESPGMTLIGAIVCLGAVGATGAGY